MAATAVSKNTLPRSLIRASPQLRVYFLPSMDRVSGARQPRVHSTTLDVAVSSNTFRV
jgi:hypothetical protein